MCSVIPHIYKHKVGRGLHFPLKYSDLEPCFLVDVEKDVYLDAWFHANHSYWKNKAWRARREGDFTLTSLSFSPRDRFRYWFQEEVPDSIVVRWAVHALPDKLAAEARLTRSVLRKALRSKLDEVAAGGLFDRRWQVNARLRIRECMLECVLLAWKDMKLVTLTKLLVDLKQDQQTGK